MRTQETTATKSSRKLSPTKKSARATPKVAMTGKKAAKKSSASAKAVNKTSTRSTTKSAQASNVKKAAKTSLKTNGSARKTPLKASRAQVEKETPETADSKSLTMQPKRKLSRKGNARFRENQQRQSLSENEVNPARRH